MPAGITVYNSETSNVQVDSEYSNYLLKAAGVSTPGSLWGDWPGMAPNTPIRIQGQNPIIAIRCSRPFRAFRKRVNSNTFDFFVYSGDNSYNVGSGDMNFQYYIFDTSPSEQGSFGLQVFTGSGSLAFDSSFGYMRVLSDIERVNLPYPNPVQWLPGIFSNDTYPQQTSNLAVINCQQSFRTYEIVSDNGMGNTITTGIIASTMYYTQGANVQIVCGNEFGAEGSRYPSFLASSNARFMVIDTTGLPSSL